MKRGQKLWLIIGGLVVAAGAGLYFSLPGLLRDAIVAQAEKAGLQKVSLRVLHAGLGRLELADITIGDQTAPALRIGRASVEYTPIGLLSKKIRGLRLTGVAIRIVASGRGFRFPGMEERKEAAGEGRAIPLIGYLLVKDAKVIFQLKEREIEIPFSGHVHSSGQDYALHADLHPLEVPVHLEGVFARDFSSGTIAFMPNEIDLYVLAKQGVFGSSFSASGRLALQGEAYLSQGRFNGAKAGAVSHGELRLDISGQGMVAADLQKVAFRLGPEFDPRNINADVRVSRLNLSGFAVSSPFRVNVRSSRWPDFEFSILDMNLDQPLPLLAERISGKVVGPWEMVKINGDFQAQDRAGLPEALGAGSWSMGKPYALSGDFQAVRKGQEWNWRMKARGDGGMSMVSGKNSVRGMLKLDASLQGDTRQARATASGRLAGADLRFAGGRFAAGAVQGSATVSSVFGEYLKLRPDPDVYLAVRGGRFLTAGGVKAAGINGRLPWSFPGAVPGKSGSFSIARLEGAGLSGREISGTLTQEGRGVAFSGEAHAGPPGIVLAFKGSFAPLAADGKLSADFLVPSTVLPSKTPLQALHPWLQGVEVGGRFGAQGRIWAADGKIGGSAVLEIGDGDFAHAGEGIVVHGLQVSVQLDNLFDLITHPSQRLLFKDLRWQGNTFRDGEVVFSGEGGGKLFIESGRFLWNRGTVTLDPLRFEPGGVWPQVTLRCQDVDLAEMLNTLAGSRIVSSDARLSGVIPLKFVNGSPEFIDGYLDSAPGSGGRLQVSKPESISGGQVLVEEAIRDFTYNWIKVRLDSRNGRLNMTVSIDGAPSRKLPLRYDPRKKDFVRDPAGKPGVELKGLLLDIRFNDVDLKDLLETGGKMSAGDQ